MIVQTLSGPIEIPPHALRQLRVYPASGGLVFSCDVCGYDFWEYPKKGRKTAAVELAVRKGWRFGLKSEYDEHGWTCPAHSSEISMTDVRADGEEIENARP